MTIQFLHKGELYTATVVLNLHNTNVIMVRMCTPIEVFSEVIFLLNTGHKWISDSPLETEFPSTYHNLVSQINRVYNSVKEEGESAMVYRYT